MAGHFRRRVAVGAVAFAAAAGLALVPSPAQAGNEASCTNPPTPQWFNTRLQEAADYPGDSVPSSWGDSLNMSRIVCWESDYRPDAENGQYYGLGQLSRTSLADYSNFSWDIYQHGTSAHPASYYQLLAALRYCKGRYGDTTTAWEYHKAHGVW
jgi:hypothetical protein